MAKIVKMPKQGLQMTEGKILKWFVKEGQNIKENEPFFEVETDKLTIVVESQLSGTVLKLFAQEGDSIPVMETIAVIGEPGEDISSVAPTGSGEDNAMKVSSPSVGDVVSELKQTGGSKESRNVGGKFVTPRARRIAKEMGISLDDVALEIEGGKISSREVLSYSQSSKPRQPKASPLAQRIAQDRGIDLSSISPSDVKGSGRIMKADVLASFPTRNAGTRLVPLTGMRRTVAARMLESQKEMAQTHNRIRVDVSALAALRESLESAEQKVSYNDILIRIVSRVLREFPYVNASWSDEGILLHDYVNMGIAVALDDGLVVPVLDGADALPLVEISKKVRDLAKGAREGTLSPDAYDRGTFTISNLGMFGTDEFVAIANPPQAAILAVGAIVKQPIVGENDEISVKPMMTLTLSYDHRIVDGAVAAQFLKRLRQYITNPLLIY
ncbi:dihydrolipoamide acetyltransferase component of pyruvate dehydrogenase complex [Synergistales bacterium]|nr:dihydrolipoamide acetyltransferase component of pyruvate dehydrogenase complex [Synergistales bacterium]